MMADTVDENRDLLENKIPFDLLEPDVQKRMKAWEHGWEYWNHYHKFWFLTLHPGFYDDKVYRALENE